jgi:hypothetical protein
MTKDLVLIILFVLTQLLNSSQNLLLVIIQKKNIFHQGAQGRLGGVVTLTLRTKILTLDRTQILAQI